MRIKKVNELNSEKETLEAKLRNQLGPSCSLASMVLQLEECTEEMKDKLMPIIITTAKKAMENQERIKFLLKLIDSRTTIEDLDNYCEENGHVMNGNNACLICKTEI